MNKPFSPLVSSDGRFPHDANVSSVKLSAMPAQEGKRGLYSPAKVGPERFLPAD